MSTSSPPPLSGDSAALVIRALLDFRSLWTTHDLVSTTGVEASEVRAVIAQLDQESLADRQAPGVVSVPSWLPLLRRWNQDFRFNRQTSLTYWRSRNRSQDLLDRIPATEVRHAVTGALAAQRWAPETPAGPPVIYTPDVHLAATEWDLIPSRKRTIVIAETPTGLVYTRTRKTETGLRLAAPSQVLADLLTGAAKTRSAAEPLIRWMLEHELDWRY
ncbi:hypothetical protein ACFV9C_26450 [Kribbella sp. NPDC059898]|uniref:hypothetical protein n=1 Tax=Kribbella sp. NPDC059898 TaxID=3346995 RepID=UPI003657F8EC